MLARKGFQREWGAEPIQKSIDSAIIDPTFVHPAFMDPAVIKPGFTGPTFINPEFVSEQSLTHRVTGGAGVWSEGVSHSERAGIVVPPHFGAVSSLASDRWYALYVRSRHEKTVETSLRLKGYSVFSPSYRTKRKRVDRIAEIEVALFPGYVFCQFDTNKRLPILMTPGVVGVVGRGNRPEPVDDTEIASIRTVALAGRPVQPWPFLRIGQRVLLQAGPLAGAEGIFLRVKDECHLVVSITLLQRAVSVVIEKEAVAPLFFGERHTSFKT